ncbi:MAG: choice-of-anchor D domain-containing protein, partial [Chloroflexi bacterium]|nr:choice-of-anchor D domain-containing protein [Chloroflexota bacterium]
MASTTLLIVAVLLALVGVAAPAGAQPPSVVVNAADMQAWYMWNDTLDQPGNGRLTQSPAGRPLGDGSLRLHVPAGQQQGIATNAYWGFRLSWFTSLAFSTYQAQTGPQAIALKFDVIYDILNPSGYQGRLVYEPYHTETVSQGVWQDWDALAGEWWASNQTASGGLCPQSQPCTWSEVLTNWPNAGIQGRFLLSAGSFSIPTFTGYADALTVGVLGTDTTFDFEPTLVTDVVREVNVATSLAGVTSPSTPWFRNDTRTGGTVAFVGAPPAPELGSGSLHIGTTDQNPTSSQAKAQLFNYAHAGTKLSDIGSITYQTYRDSSSTNSGLQVPGLNVEVFTTGSPGSDTTLVWEPPYNTGQGAIIEDDWQLWDAINDGQGVWWSTQTIPGVCAFTCYVTWDTILANNPNATIAAGIGINAGSGWVGVFSGGADALSIGIDGVETTYDFEPDCWMDCYVDGTNGDDSNSGGDWANAKKTIQAAINAVQPTGTVHVNDGTYAESPKVTKSLTLTSENGAAVTEIELQENAGYLGSLHITGDDVTVRGFTIVGYAGTPSIPASTNITVGTGLGDIVIEDNHLKVGAAGPVTTGDDAMGLLTYYSLGDATDSLTVTGNTFEPASGSAFRAFWINPAVDAFTFSDNLITGTFTAGSYTQALDSLVEGNTVLGTGTSGAFGTWGYPDASDGYGTAVFRANTITDTAYGFSVVQTDKVTIEHNVVSSVTDGVLLVGTGGVANFTGTEILIRDNSFALDDYATGKLVTSSYPVTVDAALNWWGTTAVAATSVTGSVDFTPILTSGTDIDSDAANGFQGSLAHLKVHPYGEQLGTEGRIQEGIDTTTANGIVDVAPSATAYLEKATARGATADTGPYQFGLFFPPSKSGITVQGVDDSDNIITDANATQALVTTNATNSFGFSGIFVAGAGATIQGLEVGNNTPSNNKTFEIIGDGFTLRDSKVSATNASVYFNDWTYDDVEDESSIATFTVQGNLFTSNGQITIASGTGHGHADSGRVIDDNEFLGEVVGPQISFRGARLNVAGVPWFTLPVGGATITNNHFGAADIHIRATDDYDIPEGDWIAWMQPASGNTFDRLVWVEAGNSGLLRSFEYTATPYVFENARQIGGRIDEAVVAARPAGVQIGVNGDTVHVEQGTYVENVVVTKSLTIQGAGPANTVVQPALDGPNPPSCGSMCAGASYVFLLQANGITITDLTVDGQNPDATDDPTDIWARNGILTDINMSLDDVTVTGTHVKNIYLRGIYASDANYPNNDVTITNNTVTNVKGDPSSLAIFTRYRKGEIANNTVTDANDAIASNGSFGIKIHGNQVTNSSSGIHTDNNGDSGQGVADEIYGNSVTACKVDGYGIFVFVPYLDVSVHDNTVTGCAVGLAQFGGHFGANPPSPATPVFTKNVVSGTGATVSSGDTTGVVLTTDTFGYGAVDTSTKVDRNSITGFDVSIDAAETEGKTLLADATCNWWGSTAGPNPAVTDADPVTVAPWLLSSDLDGDCDAIAEVDAPEDVEDVLEGVEHTNTGSFSQEPASITASIGTVEADELGVWTWTLAADSLDNDGLNPAIPVTVTIMATGTDGSEAQSTFDITILNVNPSATFTVPAVVEQGAQFTISLDGATDASAKDAAGAFTFEFVCDDVDHTDPSESTATCTAPLTPGLIDVSGTVRDKDYDPLADEPVAGATTYTLQVLVVEEIGVFITPAPHDFADQVVGTVSPTQVFTITNNTNNEYTVDTVGFFVTLTNQFQIDSGTPNTCDAATLAPLGTCTFGVIFTPLELGAHTTTLNALWQLPAPWPLPMAGLSGTGIAGAAPDGAIDGDGAFGAITIGTTDTAEFTIGNDGDADLSISSIAISGSSRFSVTDGTCTAPGTVAPTATCTIVVTFAPTAVPEVLGQLVVVTNDGTLTADLSGEGIVAPVPAVAIDPNDDPAVFGPVLVGLDDTITFTVTNEGDAGSVLHVNSVTIVGSDTFELDPASITGIDLDDDDELTFDVTFTPIAGGVRQATLIVDTNVGNLILTLRGTGTVPAAEATVDPDALTFGPQDIAAGPTAAQTITVTNTGDPGSTLTIQSITQTGSATFLKSHDGTPVDLAQGEDLEIDVTYDPSAVGEHNGTIKITTNAGTFTVALTGTGTSTATPQPQASVAPDDLDFGSVNVGVTSATQSIVLSNANDNGSTLTVTSITRTGTSNFAVDSTDCDSASLTGSQTCTIDVTLTPSVAGERNGTVVIQTNGGTLLVPLTGIGVAVVVPQPAVAVDPTSLDFGPVDVGDTSSVLQIEVSNGNANGSTLTVTGITRTGTSNFAMDSTDCDSASLTGSQTCTMDVTLTPSVAGERNGTVVIQTNGGTAIVPLTGIGVPVPVPAPVAELTPEIEDTFLVDPVPGDDTKTFTVTNTGTG